MTINITNSIGQHKIPQRNKTHWNKTPRNTETKHNDLSCHVGTCMVHLNSLPPRAAGVNYWFFLLARLVVDVGKMRDAAMQNRRRNEHAKRWIFREIAKLRCWWHAPRLTAPLLRLFTSMRSWLLFHSWWQWQLPHTRAVVFRRDDTLPTSKTSLKMTRQP